MKVTALQYRLDKLANWQAYQTKITSLVTEAKQQGSDLILFPEYAGMELTSWIPGDLAEQFEKIQDHLPDYLAFHQKLANQRDIYIQTGTIPVKAHAHFKNRAFLFGPHQFDYQDKMFLTPAEKETGLLQPGNEIKIFQTPKTKLAIAICYDSEFPSLVQEAVIAGANLILVPSCTETLSGFTRVSVCCRARAIENQCYIANAYLIGDFPACDYVSTNVGQAGIFGPADSLFPLDGILAQGNYNEHAAITSELIFEKLSAVRKQGQTYNYDDALAHDGNFTIQSTTI